MIVIGKTDAFERMYMEKFRTFASKFGEFVNYEHDRGARDIGLHLTHKLGSGKERLSTALCWFQLKGIMKSTLSESDFKKNSAVKISLNVEHLRYWYLQPMPTYLVLYVESVDTFFILNIQKYVSEIWGKEVLSLPQKTATVEVPTKSILDDQAFRLMLKESDIEQWKKILGAEEDEVRVCLRDYELIWHLGTAADRNVEHRIMFMDWQSKTRSQFYIQERPVDASEDWHTLREHWQFLMNVFHLEGSYPYIEFFALDLDDGDPWYVDDDEYREAPHVTLSNGNVVHGKDEAGEYFEYKMGLRLNEVGEEMFEWVADLSDIGLIEITPGKSEMISVAPWHGREV